MVSLSRLALVVAAGALVSCGPSDAVVEQCIDQCLAASGCPAGPEGCPDLCESERAFSNRIDCANEYETMLDCIDGAPDACDQFGWCPDEVSTYFACFGDYCTANPDDSECGSSTE